MDIKVCRMVTSGLRGQNGYSMTQLCILWQLLNHKMILSLPTKAHTLHDWCATLIGMGVLHGCKSYLWKCMQYLRAIPCNSYNSREPSHISCGHNHNYLLENTDHIEYTWLYSTIGYSWSEIANHVWVQEKVTDSYTHTCHVATGYKGCS